MKQDYRIVILNYNSSKETIGLYKQLISYGIERKLIIVIDNSSTVDDVNKLKGKINESNIILNDKNLGYAGGNNIGIEIAKERAGVEYVWILNPDIRVEQDTLEVLLNLMESDKKIAAVGPRICERQNPTKIFSDGAYIDASNNYKVVLRNFGRNIYECGDSTVKDLDYIAGSCILLRLDAIRSVGPINEIFFLYYEEADWCLRAKQKGWKIAVTTNAMAFHTPSKKERIYHYFMSRNRIRFIKLHSKTPFKNILYYFREIALEFVGSVKIAKLPKNYFSTRLIGMIAGLLPIPSSNQE